MADCIGTGCKREALQAELDRVRKSERDNEAQLVRIARCVGRDAMGAPEHDRTIAGAAIEEIERLRAALQEADTMMGHDDAETAWRERWAFLWHNVPLTGRA